MVYEFLFYFHLFSICFAYNQLMLLAMSILRTLCVRGGMGCSCKCWWKTMPKHSPNMSQKSRQKSLFNAKPLVHLIALDACENRHFKYCACIIIRNYGGVDRWLLRECDHILAQSFRRCSNVCNLFTSFVCGYRDRIDKSWWGVCCRFILFVTCFGWRPVGCKKSRLAVFKVIFGRRHAPYTMANNFHLIKRTHTHTHTHTWPTEHCLNRILSLRIFIAVGCVTFTCSSLSSLGYSPVQRLHIYNKQTKPAAQYLFIIL